MQYKLHTLAFVFPPLSREEYEKLKASIRENGQLEPIAVFNGEIYDGRHRYQACVDLGLEPIVTELAPDCNFQAYVVAKNNDRRHLTESQRSMVAGRLAKLKVGGDRRSEDFKVPIGTPSLEQAADMLNVGRRSVARAKQVLDAGSKEIIEAVEAGQLPVSFAAKFVTEEDDKPTQSKLWKQGGKEALKAHISEASTYADADDELRVSASKTIARMWKKWNAVERAAVRVWIDEHFLDSEG
jgi:ParB-like chromosome segregation protein Spo0J